jgi:type I restriction-modification system DNA methylase subunit
MNGQKGELIRVKKGNAGLYNMKDYHREFIRILESIKPSKHSYETFSDWLIMASASLYAWKKDASAEEEYAEAAKGYTPEELDRHGQLLAVTVNALENMANSSSGYDFLGEVFMAADFGNGRNGQFFTPYNVSFMMAKMLNGNAAYAQGRVERICDPCCGAGCMLIASAMAVKELDGRNYQKDYLYIGQDIDAQCARMAFIQTSLLGLPAVIACGSSLTNDVHWERETIGWHLAGMEFRLRAEKLLDFIQAAERQPEHERPAETIPYRAGREYAQGELF